MLRGDSVMNHNFKGKFRPFNDSQNEVYRSRSGSFSEIRGKIEKRVNVRTYAKYLLQEGSTIEKRELLSCMKSELIILNKILVLGEKN
ncbi:MAG: hypothetical protein A3I89_03790 [Candidatus Harrisonbacteria bacterium RIFCSPLOWO2_02_FULL_41_11]|uniref:Uncharacterized protein n=1 Tax=Candidatus Harrisonbacteria bacterium RIFCSPHIGHO2_02_FULL_42_16 TaxID=1798404 RepID=A0A1G1ZG17_9BACT|nr:MAG: hypothetical protein A3B92_01545 [Candidatus Harrisonbacteria bacterium RIFCSPHIGHO2_02_FULL_42_16]OGY66185.1 MAG: hypothetical protein A3I89_03790 [Candidatus Harrisonbacteria bacterium RIFCSPLOWO2_02_FULL_41_11]